MAVVNVHTFPPGSRKAFRIGGKQGRRALLINNRGNLHCIDAQCFHFGGPLWEGEIEEIGERSCLKCPWHEYRVDIATGHCFDNFGTSKGMQQRTHHVQVDQSTGDVYVKENLPVFGQRPMGSDKYCDKKSGVTSGSVTMSTSQAGRRAGAASTAARRARLQRMQASKPGQQSILNFTRQQKKPTPAVHLDTPKPSNPNDIFQSSPTKENPMSQLTQPSSTASSYSQENFFSQQTQPSLSTMFSAASPERRRNSDELVLLTQQENLLTQQQQQQSSPSSSPPITPQHQSLMRQSSLTDAFRSTRRQTQQIQNARKFHHTTSTSSSSSSNNPLFASPSPVKGLSTQRRDRDDEYVHTQPDDTHDLTQQQLSFDDSAMEQQQQHDDTDGGGDMMEDDQTMGMTDNEDDYQLTQPRQSVATPQQPKTLRQSSIASYFSQR